MAKVTIYPQSDRVVVENDNDESRSMETYEFVIDLASIFEFLGFDIEVEEVDDE